MRKVTFLFGVLLVLGSFVVSSNCFAEEVEESGEWSYGKIVQVTESQIVVKEYDYNTEEEGEVIYRITSETIFKNIQTYSELLLGDDVEIDYKESNGKKIAMVITKELVESSEEYGDYEKFEWNEYESEDSQELDDSIKG